MKIKFSLCLPSRGRTAQLKSFVESAINTAKLPREIEFVIFLDQEDDESCIKAFPNIKFFKTPRLPVSTLTNAAYSQSTGEYVMYASDDILFQSQGWDTVISDSFETHPEKWLIHGNDRSPNSAKIATHGFVRRKIAEKLGYLLPPYFESIFADTYLTFLAKKLHAIRYLEEVIIEHRHVNWLKASMDKTYFDAEKRRNFYYEKLRYSMLVFEKNRDLKILRNQSTNLNS